MIFTNAQPQENSVVSDSLRKNAVKLFIDCRVCDIDYIRKEILFVNYVRDVREAQVYLLVTQQQTGSGGSEYTFSFLGQKRFTGHNDTLVYVSGPNDTRDETRRGMVKILKMGLMSYVAKTPIYEEVNISHLGRSAPEEVIDKWNYWVFDIETRPRLDIEESNKEISVRNSVSAVKITPEWKIDIDFNHNYNWEKFITEDTTYINERRSKSLNNLFVKSLNEHWSVGAKLNFSTSTYSNIKFSFIAFPAIEYNIFPYSEATRRQLRFLYSTGYSSYFYNDTTFYNKIKENLFRQELEVAYLVQEKWGSISISLEGSNYFHDFKKNRLELDGFIRIRIIKGLSLQINGSIARIHDQLSLQKGELSATDILLKQHEMATEYRYDGSIGITYTFGSIYNNVVNPRFGSRRGDFSRFRR